MSSYEDENRSCRVSATLRVGQRQALGQVFEARYAPASPRLARTGTDLVVDRPGDSERLDRPPSAVEMGLSSLSMDPIEYAAQAGSRKCLVVAAVHQARVPMLKLVPVILVLCFLDKTVELVGVSSLLSKGEAMVGMVSSLCICICICICDL